MTYQDALEYLHIAENAYDAGAYAESADIVRKLAYYAIDKRGGDISEQQRADITLAVKQAINRFTYCPDEAVWEVICNLGDLFN